MSSLEAIVLHPARRLIIISFLIALPLNIGASVSMRGVLPAVGLVPLGLSALLAVLCVLVSRIGSSDSPKERDYKTPALVAFAGDVLSVVGLLVVLLLCWTKLSTHWPYYLEKHQLFLVAYATVPMIFSFVIHAYLALIMIYHAFGLRAWLHRLFAQTQTTCPRCHENLQPVYAPYFSFARGEYQPVETRDNERFHDDEDASASLLDPSRDMQTGVEGPKGKGPEMATA